MSETVPHSPNFEEIKAGPEYQTKLKNATEDAVRFATRVKAVAEGAPTEADITQLRHEYEQISESALVAHDSIPDSTNNAPAHGESGSGLYIKGTEGSFLASIRIKMLEVLGDGDYSGQTKAIELFKSKIDGGMGNGLYSRRDRIH